MARRKTVSSLPSPPAPRTDSLPASRSPSLALALPATTALSPSSPCQQRRSLRTSPALPDSPLLVAAPRLPPPQPFRPPPLMASYWASLSPRPASASPATMARSPSPAFPTQRISLLPRQPADSPLLVVARPPLREAFRPASIKCASFFRRARATSPSPARQRAGPPVAASAPWSPTFRPVLPMSLAEFSASQERAAPV